MNKYLALQKDVFDINKVTVVGSPTITSDGVASGFSSGNYIRTNSNNIVVKNGVPFKIKGAFKLATLETAHDILSTSNDWNIFIYCNTLGQMYFNLLGSSYYVLIPADTLQANKKYFFEASYDTKIIKLSLYDENKDLIKEAQKNAETAEFEMTLGLNWGATTLTTRFNGAQYLAEYSITSGDLAYTPTKPTYLLERRKEGFDPSKFTVVGSPSITEYGVASGFGNVNYLKTKSSFGIPMANSWSIIFPTIKVNTYSKYFWGGDTRYGGIVLAVNSEYRIVAYMSSDGKTWDIASGRDNLYSQLTFKNGDEVNLRIDFTGDKYVLYIFKDNVWQEQATINSSLKLGNFEYFTIGQWTVGNNFDSSIDLPSLSITVDGKEVFTGAKEQFYMLRR